MYKHNLQEFSKIIGRNINFLESKVWSVFKLFHLGVKEKFSTQVIYFSHQSYHTVCVCVCVWVLHAVELALTSDDLISEWHPWCLVLHRLLSSCRLTPMASFMESLHLIYALFFFSCYLLLFPAVLSFSNKTCLLRMYSK